MDDLTYGSRDKRGNWHPKDRLKTGPVFVFPPRPLELLRWLPHYFLPWNALFMASALAFWLWLTPDIATLKSLQWGWVLAIFARNCAAVLLFFGAFELRLYVRRAQGASFKFNGKFPADGRSEVFMFRRQNTDNMIRAFGSGVLIWTAYEVLILWIFANGWVPWLNFSDNFWWLLAIGLLLSLFHEAHFFSIHRLIHVPILYKWVHSVHHNSINPSPWSSLSMHPVEHLLYFSGALVHLLIGSHPVLAIYHLHIAGFGAVVGHIGFDKIVAGEAKAMDTHAFAHYLHHKYFEVNYADGTIPLDKWFGTWHDGTKEGEAIMEARMEKKRARLNAGKGA